MRTYKVSLRYVQEPVIIKSDGVEIRDGVAIFSIDPTDTEAYFLIAAIPLDVIYAVEEKK